jgi:hypothetical protein
MAPVLDHVFILCARGAPEAEALLRLGLSEGPPNVHPGQGTACRRFFFQNLYLELLWVSDAGEAQSPPTQPTRLYSRWAARRAGASPFGLVFRPSGEGEEAPFPSWAYRPSYLPAPMALQVAHGTRLSEPELFYLGVPRRPVDMPLQPLQDSGGLASVTSVAVTIPGPATPALRAVEALGLVSFVHAPLPLLTLDFQAEPKQRGSQDVRPALPLFLRW